MWNVYVRINNHRLLYVAAGVAFYTLFGLFPAVAALVSLYGLFADPTLINEHLSLLVGIIPEGTLRIIDEHITHFAATRTSVLSFGFLFGLGLALWSANVAMKAMIDALNLVFDETERRGFVRLTLEAFTLTIGGLFFITLALGAVVVMPLVLAWLGIESRAAQIIAMLRWPTLLVLVLLWLAVLYRYGPNRIHARWQWFGAGSVFAATAWLASSALFSWYLSNIADYDATYGSIGAVIGLMMWLWLSVVVTLVGGEIDATIQSREASNVC